MTAYIRLDLFPAIASVNSTDVYKSCRAIVTDDAVYIYVDSENGPAVAFQGRLADYYGDKASGYTAETDDGDTVHMDRYAHCGCGSRLRGFSPFPGVPMARRK